MRRRPPVAPRLGERRNRRWLMLAVTAVVVAGGLVVADVAVRRVVENRIASSLEQQIAARSGYDATVTAHLDAGSALLALVTGRSDGVGLDVAVPVAQLGNAWAADGQGRDATTLSTDGGLLVASTTLRMLGPALPVVVTLRPEVSDGVLQIVPTAVQVAGTTLSVDLLAGRGELAGLAQPRQVDLGDLPDGVLLTGADVAGEDLVLHASADANAASGLRQGASP